MGLSTQAAVERLLLRAMSNPALSRPLGWLAERRLPRPLLRALIRAYVRVYGVDLSEAAEPLDSYATFNAFFTRRLRRDARPVAGDPGLVVSPTDSRLQSIGPLTPDARLEQVKGRSYGVADLLGDAAEAKLFGRGVHATLYLSPAMYHRVHSPVDGRIRCWRYLPGRLFPVNALAVRHVEGLFTVNERVAVSIDSERFGAVALVLVGAANVGRISLAFDALVTNSRRAGPAHLHPPQPIPVRRGDELAVFNLGSTVVVLAADPALRPAGVAEGGLVRLGQPLWRRAAEGER